MEPRLEHMRRMLLLASMLRTDPKCVGKCVGLRGSRWGTRTRHARCMQCAPYLRTHCVCTLRTRRVYATCTLAHALLHMHPAHALCTCTLHMHPAHALLHMHSAHALLHMQVRGGRDARSQRRACRSARVHTYPRRRGQASAVWAVRTLPALRRRSGDGGQAR